MSGRFRYDPKSKIKTQTTSNVIYPKQVFIIKEVKRGSGRTEWKEKAEIKQGCGIELQEQSPPWIQRRPIGPQSSVLQWWVHMDLASMVDAH